MTKIVIWPEPVLDNLRSFRSPHFTPQESNDFIAQLMLETEDLLTNSVLTQSYIEEYGKYKGLSRVVIRKFIMSN